MRIAELKFGMLPWWLRCFSVQKLPSFMFLTTSLKGSLSVPNLFGILLSQGSSVTLLCHVVTKDGVQEGFGLCIGDAPSRLELDAAPCSSSLAINRKVDDQCSPESLSS